MVKVGVLFFALLTAACASQAPMVKDVFYSRDGKLMMTRCELRVSAPGLGGRASLSDCRDELVGGRHADLE